MRLYYMLGGILTFDQSVFTHMHGMGNPTAVSTPIFLIDHPEGKVLFETGVHEGVVTDPVGHWGKQVIRGEPYVRAIDWEPDVSPEQHVERQLAALGVEPDDIRYVILSVLVPDHAGGMHAFPNATFIVQFQELQDAWNPPSFMPYHYDRDELLRTQDFDFRKLYDEDLDLYGDGSIEILFCPAHTRGEQALVVRLPNTGTIVMPAGVIPQKANAGVIPQKANWVQGVITGTPSVDPAVVERSMRRLKRIAEEEDALVLFHHDAEDWKTYKMAPDYYD